MKKPPATSRTVDKGQPPARPRRGVGFAIRRLSVVVLVVAACYLAYGFGRLWAEWREARQPAPPRPSEPAVAAALNPIASVLPLAGQWSFGDLDWNLRSSIMGRGEVAGCLESLASPPKEMDFQQLPDVSVDILDIAATLHLQPVDRNGYRLYRLDRSDLKAELVSREVDGHPKAVAAACAYPLNGDRWQVFELTPQSASPKIDPQASHLLPLPSGAVRRGGRFADDGRLLLELISISSDSDTLVTAWRAAGWEVRPSGLGDPNGFSFLCARGNDVIYAWSANPPESLQSLMLVRSPTDAELQALQQQQ